MLIDAQLPPFVEDLADVPLRGPLRRSPDAANDVILVLDVLLQLDVPLLERAVEEVIVLGNLHLAEADHLLLEDIVVRRLMRPLARHRRVIHLALLLAQRFQNFLRVALLHALEAVR